MLNHFNASFDKIITLDTFNSLRYNQMCACVCIWMDGWEVVDDSCSTRCITARSTYIRKHSHPHTYKQSIEAIIIWFPYIIVPHWIWFNHNHFARYCRSNFHDLMIFHRSSLVPPRSNEWKCILSLSISRTRERTHKNNAMAALYSI